MRAPMRMPAMLSTYAVPGRGANEPGAECRAGIDDESASEIDRCAVAIDEARRTRDPMNVESESKRSVNENRDHRRHQRQAQRAHDVEFQERPTRNPAR